MFSLDNTIVNQFKSNSQKVRIMTEKWVWDNIFCPNCWNQILHYENNRPVADFFCKNCEEEYELKSWKKLWKKITDWAYFTMIERLKSTKNPNLFFLNYDNNLLIRNFIIIPKHFFTNSVIEKRNALWDSARRAWWIWCNILFSKIPEAWKIFYIKNWEKLEKKDIISQRKKTLFIREEKWESRWWTLEIIKCIELLNKKDFSLNEVYSFEESLKEKFSNNNFIKDKIRQQLQILRDKDFLEFLWNWKYRLL